MEEAFKKILESKYILIVTHINPDIDTIGSALALSNFMKENKINHKVYGIDIPKRFDFLPLFNKIISKEPKSFDLVICVDSATKNRLSFSNIDNYFVINIDHHISNSYFGNINIVKNYESTARVVWEFLVSNNVKISKNIASCLFCAMYDDSNAFTTNRVTKDTFNVVNSLIETKIDINKLLTKLYQRDSLAKYRLMPKVLNTLELFFEGVVGGVYLEDIWLDETGCLVDEIEDVVEMVLKIGIVDIAFFIRRRKDKFRVSLRSKTIDVGIIASSLDGGGHQNSAGCSIEATDILIARDILLESIKNFIKDK